MIPINATVPNEIPKAKGSASEASSFLQVELHPSPSALFPSSHCYKLVLRIPFPHSSVQVTEQPSPATLLPSSQVSPVSTIEFPHVDVLFVLF